MKKPGETSLNFPCSECGHEVTKLIGKSGRMREHKIGVHIEIPADFLLPTCTNCDEYFTNGELSERLNAIMETIYRKSLEKGPFEPPPPDPWWKHIPGLRTLLGLGKYEQTKPRRQNL